MGRLMKGPVKTGLQPQPQTSHGGPSQALQPLQAAQEETVGLLRLLRQLPLPDARCHRRSEPPDTDGITQHQLSQPVITNMLQGEAKFLIIPLWEMISIVLQQFGFESAKHLSDYGEFLHQRMTLPRITTTERGHHHPSHAVAWRVPF